MTSTNNTSSAAVTKGITPVAKQGETIVIHTANGPVVRKVKPAPQQSTAAKLVAWLKG